MNCTYVDRATTFKSAHACKNKILTFDTTGVNTVRERTGAVLALAKAVALVLDAVEVFENTALAILRVVSRINMSMPISKRF